MAQSREEALKRRALYRENNKEKIKQARIAYNASKPYAHRDSVFKRKYGISLGDVEDMLAAQGGMCKICTDKIDMLSKHVDHCHSTGTVRVLLCKFCNLGIGMLRDNPAIMRTAAAYVSANK